MSNIVEIIINGKKLAYGTSADASPETSNSVTNTFDGAVTQGLDEVPWNVEIEKIRYEDLATHQEMNGILEKMFGTPAMVTIRETVVKSGSSYTVVDDYHDCVLDGNGYTIKPEENTVEKLKFKAASRERTYE